MKTKLLAVFLAFALSTTAVAGAEEPAPDAPTGAGVEEAGVDGVEPEPTPAERSFECRVDVAGERCTVPLGEGNSLEGTVAYRQEHTGKWVTFGSGLFNADDQPHGCGWVLTFRERLVEERGCFEKGKRNGTWETCRMRLDKNGVASPMRSCAKTEYEAGVVIVKAKEPEPEPEEAAASEESKSQGDEGGDGQSEAPAEVAPAKAS